MTMLRLSLDIYNNEDDMPLLAGVIDLSLGDLRTLLGRRDLFRRVQEDDDRLEAICYDTELLHLWVLDTDDLEPEQAEAVEELHGGLRDNGYGRLEAGELTDLPPALGGVSLSLVVDTEGFQFTGSVGVSGYQVDFESAQLSWDALGSV